MFKYLDINKVFEYAPAYHCYTTDKIKIIESNKNTRIYERKIEHFLKYLAVRIVPRHKHTAQYDIGADRIQMPLKCTFIRLHKLSRKQNYYATLFHELAHWTGHKSRINRKSLIHYNPDRDHKDFDPELCVLEELTAEIASNMMLEFFKLQVFTSATSMSFLHKELSSFDKPTQFRLYKKALVQAQAVRNYLVNRYKLYEQSIE